jgi:hypothetical protein
MGNPAIISLYIYKNNLKLWQEKLWQENNGEKRNMVQGLDFSDFATNISKWLQLQTNKVAKKVVDDGWNLVVKEYILRNQSTDSPELKQAQTNLVNFYQQNIGSLEVYVAAQEHKTEYPGT